MTDRCPAGPIYGLSCRRKRGHTGWHIAYDQHTALRFKVETASTGYEKDPVRYTAWVQQATGDMGTQP